MRFYRKVFIKIQQKIFSIYALVVFGKKVSAHGFFRVLVPENVNIGNGCSINHDVFIVGRHNINIGNNVTLSARVMLIDTGLELGSENRGHDVSYICIEDDVWIGAGAIVLYGITIGKGSVIGAGSVVTNNIPPKSVAVGNPARVIREITE